MLIAVNLLMRTVGVSFNIYISNRAGGEVMGLYSLLSGVYTFALTLGCGGINLGTTRMVADTLGKLSCDGNTFGLDDDCRGVIRRVLSRCLTYSLILSCATGFVLFVSAGYIGRVWLGDERTVNSLRVLALTLPPIALSSCLSGYFTAVRRVSRNAAVSIIGQFARIGLCAYLLSFMLADGIEGACLALVLGGALSELVSFILSFIAYEIDKNQYLKKPRKDMGGESDSLTRDLLGITVPVTLSACLRSGLITIEHILIPRGLKKSGASWAAALSSYGVLSSMVLPVVLFPSAFISSFSGLLVPEIAESNAASDSARVARISEKIITPALIFSFGVAGIMSCFSDGLGMVLYNSAEAGRYIRMLAPLIPIMYVDSSVDAVLKGMGEQVYSMNVNIADALASVILVWILTPRMGLYGYIVTIYFTEILNTTLSLTRMLTVSKMRISLWRQVFGPLTAVLGVCCLLNMVLPFILPLLPLKSTTAQLVFSISAAAVLYVAVLPLVGVVRKSDVRLLKSIVK
ncbi:MAG: polysaccharide biosynthesis C-terminal domain-containing protein [Clostridia bacterium]|nr:polysaccharide biosynthesis C-terminal domain-containing protein [Clostridia bacterium]